MLVVDGIKLYTRAELASMLNVGLATISNYHRRGELRKVTIGKRVYSSEEALRDFLNGKIPELRKKANSEE
jgi:Helix-turn-helix domain